MPSLRSLALAALAGLTLAGTATLTPTPASAQFYYGDRPPIVDYDRERRREAWRERREMERQDAYQRGRRDARREEWRGERRRPVRCETYRVQRPDAYGVIRSYREQRCF